MKNEVKPLRRKISLAGLTSFHRHKAWYEGSMRRAQG